MKWNFFFIIKKPAHFVGAWPYLITTSERVRVPYACLSDTDVSEVYNKIDAYYIEFVLYYSCRFSDPSTILSRSTIKANKY